MPIADCSVDKRVYHLHCNNNQGVVGDHGHYLHPVFERLARQALSDTLYHFHAGLLRLLRRIMLLTAIVYTRSDCIIPNTLRDVSVRSLHGPWYKHTPAFQLYAEQCKSVSLVPDHCTMLAWVINTAVHLNFSTQLLQQSWLGYTLYGLLNCLNRSNSSSHSTWLCMCVCMGPGIWRLSVTTLSTFY